MTNSLDRGALSVSCATTALRDLERGRRATSRSRVGVGRILVFPRGSTILALALFIPGSGPREGNVPMAIAGHSDESK